MVKRLHSWGYKKRIWDKVNSLGLYLSKNKQPLIPIYDKSVDRFVYIGVLDDSLVDIW